MGSHSEPTDRPPTETWLEDFDERTPIPVESFPDDIVIDPCLAPAAGLRAWSSPDASGPSELLEPGSRLIVRERRGTWAQAVTADGSVVWVDDRLLIDADAPSSAPAPPA